MPISMPTTELYRSFKIGQIDTQGSAVHMADQWQVHELMGRVTLTCHLMRFVFTAITKPAPDRLSAEQTVKPRSAACEQVVPDCLAVYRSSVPGRASGRARLQSQPARRKRLNRKPAARAIVSSARG